MKQGNGETKKAHVLVVDDDETTVEAIRSGLLREGFEHVHVAYDGAEALEVLEEFGEEIFVVSLGLRMPRVDGFEVMHKLATRHKHIVGIVMLTGGGATKENEKRFKELGTEKVIAFDFVAKPCNWKEFYGRIRSAIEFVRAKRYAAGGIDAASLVPDFNRVARYKEITDLFTFREIVLAEENIDEPRIAFIRKLVDALPDDAREMLIEVRMIPLRFDGEQPDKLIIAAADPTDRRIPLVAKYFGVKRYEVAYCNLEELENLIEQVFPPGYSR